MLKIRLARVGKKKKPSYRFVISESSRDLYGSALEILGHYNPFTKICDIKKDRVTYWIGKGAQLSPTVNNLFVDQNIITGKKVTASKPGKKAPAETASEAPTPASATSEASATPAPVEPAEEKTPEAPTETTEKQSETAA